MSQFRVVIFDYDGTLMDTLDAYYDFAQKFQKEQDFWLFKTRLEMRDALDAGLVAFRKLLSEHHVSIFRMPFLVRRMKKESLSMDTSKVVPYKGIKTLLKGITVPQYIVTSNISDAVKKQLQRHGMDNFEAVLGADFHSSKVRKIKKVCAMAKCPPSEVLFVSDTSSDITEGKKAGVFTIAVGYGYGNVERTMKAEPDAYVGTVAELKTLMTTLLT